MSSNNDDNFDLTLLTLRTTPVDQNRYALQRLPPPPPPRPGRELNGPGGEVQHNAALTSSLFDELERSLDGFESKVNQVRNTIVRKHVKVRNTVENFSRSFKKILENEFNSAREAPLSQLKEHYMSKLKRLEFILCNYRSDLNSLFNTKALRLSYLNDKGNHHLNNEIRVTIFNLEKHEKIYFACPCGVGNHGNHGQSNADQPNEIDYIGRLFYTNAFDVYKKIKYLHLSRDCEEIRLIRPRDVIDDELNLNDMDNRNYLNHAFDHYPENYNIHEPQNVEPNFNENGYANNPFDHNVRDEDYEIIPMSKTKILYYMKKKDYSIIQVKIGDERGFLESELAFNSKRVVYNKFVANEKYILRAYLTDTSHFYVELFNERLSRVWIKRLANAISFPFAITPSNELIFYSYASKEYQVYDLDFNKKDSFKLNTDKYRPFSRASLVKLTESKIYAMCSATSDGNMTKLKILDRTTQALLKEVDIEFRSHLAFNSSFIDIDEFNASIVTKLENSNLIRYYDSDGRLLVENTHPFIKNYGHVFISKDGDIFYYDNSNNKMFVI